MPWASYALIENRFFSGMVRIQTERGHQVVSSGPYRWMRHPGYAGALVTYLATPLFLDSIWAFLPAVFLTVVLVIRTSWRIGPCRMNWPATAIMPGGCVTACCRGCGDAGDLRGFRKISEVWIVEA